MDPLVAGSLAIAVMLLLIALGLPIAISMALVSFGGMYLAVGLDFALGAFRNLPYSMSTQFAFVAIPMFMLMGAFAFVGGVTTELYTFAYRLLSRFRGSLYYATIVAAAGFAAVSGSSVVSASVFTRISLPEMIRFKFNRGIGAGCIAASGTFAAMIPPSITMVVYGIITGESIGALLIAGVLPGLLTVLVYVVGLQIMLRFRPDWAPPTTDRFSWAQKLDSFKKIWAVSLLAAIVIGGIYSGIMPPSAAGTLGAAGALVICILRRRMSRGDFWKSLRETGESSAALFLIMIGGLLLSRMLLAVGFVDEVTKLVQAANLSPTEFILFVILIYVVLGMFIDALSMLIMTIPFIYPAVKALAMDPIWFGILVVKLVEIAVITPPVGLNLYAVLSASGGSVKTHELLKGIVPFLVLEFVTLVILWQFPAISTYLPKLMLG